MTFIRFNDCEQIKRRYEDAVRAMLTNIQTGNILLAGYWARHAAHWAASLLEQT